MYARAVAPLSCGLLACGLLAPETPGQNLVRNGDFTAANLAPWTTSGYARNPGVMSFNVDGTGASRSYAASPGGRTGPPFNPHNLQQQLPLVPIRYELAFDVAQVSSPLSFSLRLGTVSVFAGNSLVVRKVFTVSRLRRNLQRFRVCARFRPASPGMQPLRFELSYSGVATATSPRLYLDNITLRPARDAKFCIDGDRILGQRVAFEVEGAASAGFLVLLSPSKLPARVRIPNVGGEFALGLVGLVPFLQGALDRAGKFSVRLQIPNLQGIGGTKLYWQALQVRSSGASLGWESQQAFYR